jgi:uncharacterized RDD family membrane protein YckC
MEHQNPYQAPRANVAVQEEADAVELAGRGQRLGAAILDALIALVWSVPLMLLLGVFDYAMRGRPLPWTLLLASTVIGFIMFLAVHGFFLKRNGQTLGKKIVGIRISDLENNVPRFGKVIALRYMPIWGISLIPVVGPLLSIVDVLFIFRSDRRCVHDLLAGTKVLRVS